MLPGQQRIFSDHQVPGREVVGIDPSDQGVLETPVEMADDFLRQLGKGIGAVAVDYRIVQLTDPP